MMEQKDRYIRFDWAVKRLLRNKANFGVLEGFLTVLLGEPIRIVEILESEGNQLNETDKFNRVDIKARNSKDEIIIVEVQNTREIYYLDVFFSVLPRRSRSISSWVSSTLRLRRCIPSVSSTLISVVVLITFTTVRTLSWVSTRATFWR